MVKGLPRCRRLSLAVFSSPAEVDEGSEGGYRTGC